MKKFLIMMMCVIMVVCFMPTVAMAGTAEGPASSFINAIRDAESGGTVTLTDNITLDQRISIDKKLTIDLAGKTITTRVPAVFDISGKGDVVITGNGTITGPTEEAGKALDSKAIIQVSGENAKLSVLNGTITAGGVGSDGMYGIYIYNGGNLVLGDKTGGPTITTWFAPIGENFTTSPANITVNNGFYEELATPNDNDSWSYFCAPLYAASSGKITINGGTFRGYYGLSSRYIDAAQTLNINGGNFIGKKSALFVDTQKGNNGAEARKISVMGGTFSSDPSAYIPKEGYVVTEENSVWTVGETPKVAAIGDKKYETLAEAVADVKDRETIELLSNCNGNGIIVEGNSNRTFAIDFNNFSYTVDGSELAGSEGTKSQCFQLLKGSTITMKDGSIIANNSACAMMLQNYSNLTLENMNIDATTGKNSVDYVVSNNCGNVHIKGSTSIKAKPGKHAFDLYYWPSNGYTEGVNVTVDTTGTIDGIIKYGSDNSTNAAEVMHDKCRLEIKNGTFNGSIVPYNCNDKPNIVITGGTFSTNPKVYVESGNVYKYNNGTYKVAATAPNNTKDYVWSASPNADGIYTESYVAPYIPSTPTTPTDNVTNSGSTTTDNASTNADLSNTTSTSNGTTTATVDKTTADKIVDKAVENKSTEVVIDATANTTTAANSTTIAQVTIPTETLGAIAEKTEADVTIKTDVAEVKMDNTAAAAVSAQATGDTVQIVAEKVKEDAAEVHFELKVVCSNGTVISDFKGGNVAVTVTLPKEMADKKVVCVYIDDNGHMSKVEGQKNADGTYTFVTGHFSTYAIMAEEEADAAIAAQTEAIKNIEIKLTSKQVKTKSGKKAVKVTWTAAAGDKTLDGVEVYRSTQRYKGYGKEPFFTSTKGGNKGSYINTKSLKKGTRYYYRVRGYILVNGEKVYTDYSTKAWRTVK